MPSRRQVLAAGCLALAGSAGCLGGSTGGVGGTTETIGSETETATSSETDATSTADETTSATETTTTAETNTTDTTTDETSTDSATTTDESALRIVVTDGDEEIRLVTGADVSSVGEVGQARIGGYTVPMTLTDDGKTAFSDGLERAGAFENREDHTILTYFEGDLLYEAGLAPSLAHEIESGEWSGEFLFQASERKTAESVQKALREQ